MALSRRRYTWEYRPEVSSTAQKLSDQVADVLGEFCESWPQFYSDAEVDGWGFGVVRFSLTVYSRDQWWVGRRALRVLSAVRVFTKIPVTQINLVSVNRLPPHDHRGRAYRKDKSVGQDTDSRSVA